MAMENNGQDELEAQIAGFRKEIFSDGYPMSIGEITNLYRNGELIIRPAFQRFFRWSEEQKSLLVESVLLGIPLPSIFVAQGEDGRWELIDGLQRVATLLELQGELRDDQGDLKPPLTLHAAKYLTALEGRVWSSGDEDVSLSDAQRLDIKRSALDIKIIKRESSSSTKYDLFQRLNSYGSPLTPQEMRSALLIGVNPDFYEWIGSLAGLDSFSNTTALGDRPLDEKFDLELVLRFLILHSHGELPIRNFVTMLDDESAAMAEEFPEGSDTATDVFTTTFGVVGEAGPDAFRRFDSEKQDFVGGFLITAFEVIAMGLGYNIAAGKPYRTDVRDAAVELWSEMETGFATGLSTEARLSRMLPRGRDLMGA